MMKFIQCIGYLAITGILSFFIGRVLPKKWFNGDEAPFKSLPVEKNGKIYEYLAIRKWKDKAPDMNKIFPKLIPGRAPKLGGKREEIELLIQETCIAEVIHALLCISGFGCLYIWQGAGGFVLTVLNIVLGNIPFIVIQRYNRPRLIKIRNRMAAEKVQTVHRSSIGEGETV